MDGINVAALAELFRGEEKDSDSEDDTPKPAVSSMGPGDVGPKTQEAKPSKSIYAKKATSDSKDIWDAEEFQSAATYDDLYDTRQQPDYDMVYKQAITSEDMFLQMGNKSAATSSCEDMVVHIKLPNTRAADVKLDVKDTFLDCRTPKYKLGLHLPHPVDSKNGRAQWDASKSTLSVTLRMNRELDMLNM